MPDPSSISDLTSGTDLLNSSALSALSGGSGGFDLTSIILSSLFAMIGVGFFMFGKRQNDFNFMIFGIMLNLYFFFVNGTAMLVVVGVVLVAAPFVLNRYYGE